VLQYVFLLYGVLYVSELQGPYVFKALRAKFVPHLKTLFTIFDSNLKTLAVLTTGVSAKLLDYAFTGLCF
jgi:hypothetical protein